MDELGTLRHDHIFLRREALAYGYDDYDLRCAVRARALARVRHGAYVAGAIWHKADEVERHRLRAHAVLLSHGSHVALSHTSAAVEHGLRLYKPDLSKVHVTCLDGMIGNATPDVVYHRNPLADSELVQLPTGEVAVGPLRAGLDTASLMSVPQGLVVLDGVVDLGFATEDEVRDAFRRKTGPRARRLHITVRLVRKGANSAGETLGRYLCYTQHVPEPSLQHEVYDEHGEFIGRTDFAWPEHHALGEFDGVTKYLRMRREDESIEEAVIREKRREDKLREITGWLMIRLIWSELFTPVLTGDRIRAQLARGRRLRVA